MNPHAALQIGQIDAQAPCPNLHTQNHDRTPIGHEPHEPHGMFAPQIRHLATHLSENHRNPFPHGLQESRGAHRRSKVLSDEGEGIDTGARQSVLMFLSGPGEVLEGC